MLTPSRPPPLPSSSSSAVAAAATSSDDAPIPHAERFGPVHAVTAVAAIAAAIVFLPRWRQVFIVLAMLAAVIPFHLLPCVLWARAVGVKVEAIGWLFGAWVARFHVAGIPLRINWIPLGGYVKLAGGRERHPPLVGVYDELPRWQQAGINLAMPLGTLLLAVALLGPVDAAESFARGYRQLYEAALDPGSLGRAWRAFLDTVARGEWRYALGTVAAKNATINLLPIPIVNGGIALMALFGPRRRPHHADTTTR